MKFATAYDDEKVRERRSLASGFACVGDSLTSQADAKDADINVIVGRYLKTGQVPGLSRLPSFGDFDGISDYREALHAVRDAEASFMRLPAQLRARFENDAQAFVEFCEDPGNRLELAELGLLAPEVADRVRKEAEAAKVKENPTGGEPGGLRPGAAAAARRDDRGSSKKGGGADETT